MKIKVLHVIKSLGRGGAEMLLPETLKMHDSAQFEFHYIYFLPWKNQLVAAIEAAGGQVSCFPATNNIALLLQFRKIVSYCKENEIQLIHAHLPWAGFVCRIVHRLTKIPLLYTEHNMQERYHVVTKAINALTFNWQSLGIGVSDDVTSSILKHIKPRIAVQTILNGVNTESFARHSPVAASSVRESLGIPSDAFVVGTVAVFRFQKRLDLWLEVFQKIIEKEERVYGIVVGAGPLQAAIEEKYQSLGLQGRLFFVGLQTEVKPYYAAMDAFMMTSSFEGLPIALLEAMSMECAIVSTDAGGIKEVVRNEEDGKLVGVAEWAHLAEKVLDLHEDAGELSRLQQAARTRVQAIFSMQAMVANLEKEYQKQLKC